VHFRTLVVVLCLGFLYVLGGSSTPLRAQGGGAFHGSSEDPAIAYSTAPLNNVVVDLNRKLQDGTVRLTFEGRSGYLRSALEALELPVESQVLVFSSDSLQRRLINERNPRALFFNDRAMLGWVRDGTVIEVTAHDEREGIVFYTLAQTDDVRDGVPQFRRSFQCLGCFLLLSVAHHDANMPYCRMTDQRLHRPAKDRLSAEQPELLGNPPAEAFALQA